MEVLHACVFLPCVMLVCILAMGVALRHVYSALGHFGGFRRFIAEFVGCLEQPVPRVRSILVAAHVVQIVASFAAVVLFVRNTYIGDMRPTSHRISWHLGMFFAGLLFYDGLRSEFKLSQFWSGAHFVDIFTLPQMIFLHPLPNLPWMTLGFLRVVSALAAYGRLDKLGVIHVVKTEVAHEVVKLVFRLSALVVCFASSVLVLEVLGELPWMSEVPYFQTAMGDISWFTLLYWACETLTTVGYGDFAPKTFPSRLVTTSFLIAGVAIFTYELNRIFDLLAQRRQGTGSFKASSTRDHVVLIGGCVRYADRSALHPFLLELFHASSRNDWPKLVLMTSMAENADKVRALLQSLLPWHAQQCTTVLVGSPFHTTDLKRCGCDSASLVFFASDSSGSLPAMEEDKENILRALSLKNAFPSTPLRLMLLKAESKATALSLGIRPERCFAMSEMCRGMMWISCRAIGWSTLFSNLVITSKPQKLTKAESTQYPWLQHYMHGMRQCICGFVPSSEFHGLVVREAVLKLYQQHSVIVIAVQIKGSIKLTPLRNFEARISHSTVCFAIAQDEETLLPVSMHQRDWRDVFVQARWHKLQEDDGRYATRSLSVGHTNTDGRLSSPKPLARHRGQQKVFRRQSVSCLEAEHAAAAAAAARSGRRPSKQAIAPCDVAGGPARKAGDSAGSGGQASTRRPRRGLTEPLLRLATWSGDSPRLQAQPRAPLLRGGGAAIGQDESARGCAGPARTAGNSPSFSPQAPSRDLPPPQHFQLPPKRSHSHLSWSPANRRATRGLHEGELEVFEERVHRFREHASERPFILLLSMSTSVASWDDIVDFVHLESRQFLPFRLPIVILCPVEPTRPVVEALNLIEDDNIGFCLGSPSWSQDLERSGVIESTVIVCLGQPVEHGKGRGSAEMLDADVLMVQRMLHRLGQAHKHTVLEFNEIDNMRLMHSEWSEDQEGHHWLDPNFASGQVFFPQVLSSFLATAYRNPVIIELMTLFWGPKEFADPGAADEPMIWQIRPRAEHVGMSCGEVGDMLIDDLRDPSLCLGLLRRFSDEDGTDEDSDDSGEGSDGHTQRVSKGYVYTNPDRHEKVRATDLLFVLGDATFARRALAEGLMPFAAEKDSSSDSAAVDDVKFADCDAPASAEEAKSDSFETSVGGDDLDNLEDLR